MIDITERQLEIIESAGKILTSSGVSGLTIKKLAEEMKFSEAALYRHFESKEAIIVAMLKYLVNDMDTRFSSIDTNLSPEDQFKSIFRTQFNFFSKHPNFIVAVFSDGLMEKSETINNCIHSIMRVKMKYLLPVIIKGQQVGYFTNKITGEEMTHIIMGSFRLLMFKWRMSNFELDIERIGNNLIESLLTILKSHQN